MTAPPLRMGLAHQEQAKEGHIVANPTICSPVRGGRGLGVVMQVQRTGMATLKSNQISADFGQFRIDVFQKGEKCGDLQKPRAH